MKNKIKLYLASLVTSFITSFGVIAFIHGGIDLDEGDRIAVTFLTALLLLFLSMAIHLMDDKERDELTGMISCFKSKLEDEECEKDET